LRRRTNSDKRDSLDEAGRAQEQVQPGHLLWIAGRRCLAMRRILEWTAVSTELTWFRLSSTEETSTLTASTDATSPAFDGSFLLAAYRRMQSLPKHESIGRKETEQQTVVS